MLLVLLLMLRGRHAEVQRLLGQGFSGVKTVSKIISFVTNITSWPSYVNLAAIISNEVANLLMSLENAS